MLPLLANKMYILKRRWSSTLDNLKLNIHINVFFQQHIGYWLFCAEVFWTRAKCRSDYVLFFVSFSRSCCSHAMLPFLANKDEYIYIMTTESKHSTK